MKKINGLARIYIVIIVAVAVILGSIIVVKVTTNKKDKKQEEKMNITQKENVEENENKIENTIIDSKDKVEELVFDYDFLKQGLSKGNVEIYNNKVDNAVILSITGVADNNIDQTNFVSTKNRWYRKIDLTDYTTLEFYARNGKTGDIMICIDDTIVKRIRYTNVPSTWTKYKVDVSEYKGEHTLAIAGGYADKTGNEDSNTQYRNIKLK